MQINSVSNQNFGKIFIAESQDNKLKLGFMREISLKNQPIVEEKISKVRKFKNTDVYVTKDGEVYIENKNKNIKVTVDGNVSLFTKYHMALLNALRIGD